MSGSTAAKATAALLQHAAAHEFVHGVTTHMRGPWPPRESVDGPCSPSSSEPPFSHNQLFSHGQAAPSPLLQDAQHCLAEDVAEICNKTICAQDPKICNRLPETCNKMLCA